MLVSRDRVLTPLNTSYACLTRHGTSLQDMLQAKVLVPATFVVDEWMHKYSFPHDQLAAHQRKSRF